MTAIAERNTGSGERLSAIGFAGSNHGLKTSFINNLYNGTHKLPTFDWPVLNYPTN